MPIIGVTGAAEFLGKAICRELHLHSEYQVIALDWCDDRKSFDMAQVAQCDWVIHTAVVAKDPSDGQVLEKNVRMGEMLCQAMTAAKVAPPVIYLSSVREGDASEYGEARAAVHRILNNFSQQNHSAVITLRIPNEFGPCGRPYYNSVVTTFCHELQTGKTPTILKDAQLDLVYVGSVAQKVAEVLTHEPATGDIAVEADCRMTVSALLEKLEDFQKSYCGNGMIPTVTNAFEIALFNTFRSYLDPAKFFPHPLVMHGDERGVFVELVKQKGGCGQFSYSSTTEHGVARGEHFHTRKIERFMVIRGKARMVIRAIDSTQRYEFELDGDKSTFVDVPIWYTHNLTNTGDGELLTAFWINEIYNPDDPDTYREKV